MNDPREVIYANYFKTGRLVVPDTEPMEQGITIYENQKSARIHTNSGVKEPGYDIKAIRHYADDNVDDIEQLAEILKRLCNAAWGVGWGELSPDLKQSEDSSKILLPQITVEINVREKADGIGGLKPTLTDVVDEVDEEGNKTGDAFLMYRQWYDCNVEFNIYGQTNKEAREIQRKFENLLITYTGYLKRNGVSEIFFLQEVSPKSSLNYVKNTPMRCIYYYIRLESITPIRQSLINQINMQMGGGQVTTDCIKSVIESGDKAATELDFFKGDSGITLEQN